MKTNFSIPFIQCQGKGTDTILYLAPIEHFKDMPIDVKKMYLQAFSDLIIQKNMSSPGCIWQYWTGKNMIKIPYFSARNLGALYIQNLTKAFHLERF